MHGLPLPRIQIGVRLKPAHRALAYFDRRQPQIPGQLLMPPGIQHLTEDLRIRAQQCRPIDQVQRRPAAHIGHPAPQTDTRSHARIMPRCTNVSRRPGQTSPSDAVRSSKITIERSQYHDEGQRSSGSPSATGNPDLTSSTSSQPSDLPDQNSITTAVSDCSISGSQEHSRSLARWAAWSSSRSITTGYGRRCCGDPLRPPSSCYGHAERARRGAERSTRSARRCWPR